MTSLNERIENLKELLKVMEAARQGKKVQSSFHTSIWDDEPNPSFNPDLQWRVRPEPKTFRVECGVKVRCRIGSYRSIAVFKQVGPGFYKIFEPDCDNRQSDYEFQNREEVPFNVDYHGMTFSPIEE